MLLFLRLGGDALLLVELLLTLLLGNSVELVKVVLILLCGERALLVQSVLNDYACCGEVFIEKVLDCKLVGYIVACNYRKLTIAVVEYPMLVVLFLGNLACESACGGL